MKPNSVIHRYLFRELLPPFGINILFFTFIFLLTEILKITNMIVNYRMGVGVVVRLLMYSMPYFLVFVIPLAVMMSVLLTLLRMSGDNEFIALEACGVSMKRLLPPVLAFCLMGSLLTALTIMEGLPRGRMAFKRLAVEVAKTSVDVGIKERQFNTGFNGVMLYVNAIDPVRRELIDVFIQDERTGETPITIVAPRAFMRVETETARFHLRLLNGTINRVDLDKRISSSTRFDSYDLVLDLNRAISSALDGASDPKDEKEMRLGELWDFLTAYRAENRPLDGRYYEALIEFHKKFSIPFACVALGLVAIPLGIRSRTARRSFGLGLGLVLFLAYYLLLSAGLVFGEAGVYPPLVGMWVPNLVMIGIGLYLLDQTVRNRPLFIERVINAVRWFRQAPTRTDEPESSVFCRPIGGLTSCIGCISRSRRWPCAVCGRSCSRRPWPRPNGGGRCSSAWDSSRRRCRPSPEPNGGFGSTPCPWARSRRPSPCCGAFGSAFPVPGSSCRSPRSRAWKRPAVWPGATSMRSFIFRTTRCFPYPGLSGA